MATATIESRVDDRIKREVADIGKKNTDAAKDRDRDKQAGVTALDTLKETFVALVDGGDASPVEDNIEGVDAWLKTARSAMVSALKASGQVVSGTAKLVALTSDEERERRLTEARELAELRQSDKKPSAREIAIASMLRTGAPMHYRDVTRAVQESGLVELKGETPEATINAMLAVAAKKGDTFVKVAPGIFGLVDAEQARASLRKTVTEATEAPAEAEAPSKAAKSKATQGKPSRSDAAKKAAATRKRNAEAAKATA